MVKILSQAGSSLADVYDVEGSIAGIDSLETRELPLVHEMGGTIFAERVVSIVRTLTTVALNQSTSFDITPLDFPVTPFRVLGAEVTSNMAGRISNAMLGVHTTTDNLEGEIPFFTWENTTDTEASVRIRLLGAAAANTNMLIPSVIRVPTFVVGTDQPTATNTIVFRGLTSAFGAGTITIRALIHIAFALQRGLSSRGLPIPGW